MLNTEPLYMSAEQYHVMATRIRDSLDAMTCKFTSGLNDNWCHNACIASTITIPPQSSIDSKVGHVP